MLKIDKGEEEKDKNNSLKENKLISDTLINKEEEKEGLFTASYLSSLFPLYLQRWPLPPYPILPPKNPSMKATPATLTWHG